MEKSVYIRYQSFHRLKRIEELSDKYKIFVGWPDRERIGYIDLTGFESNIEALLIEVDYLPKIPKVALCKNCGRFIKLTDSGKFLEHVSSFAIDPAPLCPNSLLRIS